MHHKHLTRVLFWTLLGAMVVSCKPTGLNQTQLKLTEYRMGSGFVFENAAQAQTGTLAVSLPNETKSLGDLGFSKGLTEQRLDVSALQLIGDVALQIAHGGQTPALIDSITLDGQSPYQVDGARETGELAVKKVAGLDQDLLHVQGHVTTYHFRVGHAAKQLAVTARIFPPADQITPTPFQYPLSNLYKEMTSESASYAYPWDSQVHDLFQGDDWSSATLGKPFFQEFSLAGTGHPSNFIFGWVSNDAENLYAAIDWTVDNTIDELTDYTKVYVKTPAGLKEFKVMDGESRWGRAEFEYTERAVYQHRTYRFKIPLSEIGMTPISGAEVQLAFAAYGTGAPPDVTISSTTNVPAPAFVAAGTTKLVVYIFKVDCVYGSDESSHWTAASITTGGTYQTSDLVANSFKLYRSNDATLDNGDTLLNTQAIVASGNALAFSGFDSIVANISTYSCVGSPFWGIVSVDVASSAAGGRTIQLGGVTSFTTAYSTAILTNNATSIFGGVQTVKGNTATTMTSSLNPSRVGQNVTFIAAVAAPHSGNGNGTPTGTIAFKEDGNVIAGCGAVPLSSGLATCNTSSLPVGSHTMTAVYSGDTNYIASTGNMTGNPQVVLPLTGPTMTLTGPSGTFPNPQSFTFTATVSGGAAQLSGAKKAALLPMQAPTGTVSFYDNGVLIPACSKVPLNASGVATCTVTLGFGTHKITATYNGDTVYSAMTAATTLTIVVAVPAEVPEGETLLLLGGGMGGLGVWLRYQWSKRKKVSG